MALLHPMYNHLGRSKKKPAKPSKERLAALAYHKAWLAARGLEPSKKPLQGAIKLEAHY